MNFDLDEEKLKEEQASNAKQKRNLALLGGIGDALTTSGTDFGSIYLGRPQQRSNSASNFASSLADTIQDPVERQGKLYQAYKGAQEAKALKQKEDQDAVNRDPNSGISRAKKSMALSRGLDVTEGMSGADIDQLMNVQKINEAEALSRVDFDKQKQLAQMRFANERSLKGLDLQKTEQEKALKKAEEVKQRETQFGVARTADDAKKLKDAGDIKAAMDAKIDELIELRRKHGAEILDRDAVARAKQLSKDLLLAKKNLESLGVLSKSDEAIVNEIIPGDPLQWHTSQLWGQDPTMTKLKAFKSDSDKDFQERLKNRLESYSEPAPKYSPDVIKYAESHGISEAEAQSIKDMRTKHSRTAGQ